MKLSLFPIVSALCLFACSSSDPTSSTASSSSGSSGGTNKGSSTSSSGSPGSTETQEQAIEGTWDITAAGSDKIGASSMTITAGQIKGTIVAGTTEDDGSGACTGTDKTDFVIAISGDTATTSLTSTTTWAPAGCNSDEPSVSILTAKRTAGSNTEGDTWSGEWAILDKDDNTPAIAVSIVGLAVKAWDNANKTGNPVVNGTIGNGSASNSTSEADVTFAARRR